MGLLKLFNYSIKTACNDTDRGDFLRGLQNMLRLLCVLTYDSKVASLLMRDEIELVKAEIACKRKGETPPQEAEGAVLLLSREQGARMGDTEMKVAETAAGIVGRQMEQ